MSRTGWEAVLTMPVAPERDHIKGRVNAPASLVQYGDYECPFCGAAYPIIKRVQARMGDRLCFAFRNFPITTAHPHAEQAAEAAEAADSAINSLTDELLRRIGPINQSVNMFRSEHRREHIDQIAAALKKK